MGKTQMNNLLVTNIFFNLPESQSMFSIGHIVQIFLTVALLVFFWFLFRKKDNWQTKVLWILFGVCFVTMANMLIFSFVSGIYNPEWYMPFHICNLFVFVLFAMAISNGKVRAFLSDYSFYFGLLGCLFAIVFPATTQLYFPSFHFLSVNMWIYHLAIGTLAVYLLSSGIYKIRLSNLWRMLAVFIPLIISAFVFNSLWDTNFCFMNPEKFYYPLNLLADYFGRYWTLMIAVIIVGLSCILMAVSFVVLSIKNKLVSNIITKNPLVIFIKENKIFDREYELFRSLLKNSKVQTMLSNAKIVFDESKILSCWDAVKDDISKMTVAQLEDFGFIFKLIKKSRIMTVLIKQIKIAKLKKIFVFFKSIPFAEILRELKTKHLPKATTKVVLAEIKG